MRGKEGGAGRARVAANEAYQICFALDAGARGIIAPMINTRAEAEAMVRACRYFPLGNRSNAGVRGEWGEFKNYRDYMDAVNNELVILPMIETNQSLENLDAIASVPGVDVLLIGLSDLSIEPGVLLDYQCDIYQRALDKIAATAVKHGIAAAMYLIPPDGPELLRPEWVQVLHHAMGPGRRPGSRTPWPGSSANDVDAGGLANSRTAQHAPLITCSASPVPRRTQIEHTGCHRPDVTRRNV